MLTFEESLAQAVVETYGQIGDARYHAARCGGHTHAATGGRGRSCLCHYPDAPGGVCRLCKRPIRDCYASVGALSRPGGWAMTSEGAGDVRPK